MKLLRELLNEIWGSGRTRGDELAWREQSASPRDDLDWWVLAPERKKYGPFPTKDKALEYLKQHTNIHHGSRLKSIPKGSTVYDNWK